MLNGEVEDTIVVTGVIQCLGMHPGRPQYGINFFKQFDW